MTTSDLQEFRKARREAEQEKAAAPPYLHNDKGEVRDLVANAVAFLEHREEFKGRLRFNTLCLVVEARDLPWDPSGTWRPLDDGEHVALAVHAQQAGVIIRQANCLDAIRRVAARTRHHPVLEYLDRLEWDGISRLDDWLFTHLGAKADNPDGEASERDCYVRAIGAKCLISAVARIRQPGCKADHMLVLEGPQGVGKSTAVAILGGEWFTDQVADLHTKDASQDLRGKWLVEMSELSAVRGKELERVKAYVSRTIDHYRAAYGHDTGDYARQCIFIGTTNELEYLQDHTGNRRFWPVALVGGIELEALRRDRDQLWAEADYRYRHGEAWHLGGDDVTTATVEQDERVIGDAWEPIIAEWLGRQLKHSFTVAEIWTGAFEGKIADLSRPTEPG